MGPVQRSRRVVFPPDRVGPFSRKDRPGNVQLDGRGRVVVHRQECERIGVGRLRHAREDLRGSGKRLDGGGERVGVVVGEDVRVERIEREGGPCRGEERAVVRCPEREQVGVRDVRFAHHQQFGRHVGNLGVRPHVLLPASKDRGPRAELVHEEPDGPSAVGACSGDLLLVREDAPGHIPRRRSERREERRFGRSRLDAFGGIIVDGDSGEVGSVQGDRRVDPWTVRSAAPANAG